MGLGGYLASKTDAQHYESELRREQQEVEELPDREAEEVAHVFRGFGLSEEEIAPILSALAAHPDRWVDFMMRFELGLEKPDARRARRSALTIAGSYVVGGLIPLASYLFMTTLAAALYVSIGVTLAALFIFGYVKGVFTGLNSIRGGLQTVFTGGLAAAAPFLIARWIN